MTAQRAFFRPDVSPAAEINGEEPICRECYTPPDAWLQRLARKHCPMSHTQPIAPTNAAYAADHALQLETVQTPARPRYEQPRYEQPQLFLIPLDEHLRETPDPCYVGPPLYLVDEMPASEMPELLRESVPSAAQLESMIDDCLIRCQVTRIAIELYAAVWLYALIKPRVALLLRELQLLNRKVSAVTKDETKPSAQLRLIEVR